MKTQNLKTQIPIGGRKNVRPNEVIMLKVNVNYTTVYLISGETLIVATTLKKLEELFSPFSFIRMNKTYTVNALFNIEKQENALKMTNLQIIVFSRRRGKSWKLGLVG